MHTMPEQWPEWARECAERAEAEVERLRVEIGEAEDAYMLCIELKDEARFEVEQLRQRIVVAMNYLTDETRDRITRIRLAQLALEDKPDA